MIGPGNLNNTFKIVQSKYNRMSQIHIFQRPFLAPTVSIRIIEPHTNIGSDICCLITKNKPQFSRLLYFTELFPRLSVSCQANLSSLSTGFWTYHRNFSNLQNLGSQLPWPYSIPFASVTSFQNAMIISKLLSLLPALKPPTGDFTEENRKLEI